MANVSVMEKFSGKIETFMTKPVKPVLSYEGRVKQYDSKADEKEVIAAIKADGNFPSNEDIITFANARLKAKERAKVIADVLEKNGYQKPAADSKVSLFSNMVKTLKLAGKSDDDAAKLAEMALGYGAAEAERLDAEARKAEESKEEAKEETVDASA